MLCLSCYLLLNIVDNENLEHPNKQLSINEVSCLSEEVVVPKQVLYRSRFKSTLYSIIHKNNNEAGSNQVAMN